MLRNSSVGLLLFGWAAVIAAPGHAQDASNAGFYLGLTGAAVLVEDNDTTISGVTIDVDYDTTFGIFGQGGYRFGNGFRVEGEVGYTSIDDASLSANGVTIDLSADIDIWTFTANAFYDISVNDWVSPYVGGGIGVARQDVGSVTATFGGTSVTTSGDSSTDLTAFGEVGLNLHVTANLDIVPAYRYQWIDNGCCGFDDTTAHILEAGLRYKF